MAVRRDAIAGCGFFEALPPLDYDAAADGNTIDLLGYDGCAFVIMVGSVGGADLDAGSYWQIGLEHGLASADGVSAWSIIGLQNILHSQYGSGGALSAITSGFFLSVCSASMCGTVHVVGYLGDTTHRYVRLVLSDVAGPSNVEFAAIACLTRSHVWPVIEAAGH